MNSIELAYQLRRLTVDSNSSRARVPPPPETISASMTSYDSADTVQMFELDCSNFNDFSPSQYYTSSFNNDSTSSAQESTTERGLLSLNNGGLSRSRYAQHNLSVLCSSSTSSVGSARSTRQVSYESGAKVGWGYYVDTPSR
mmetsp:Transcript_26943/g.56165  ORF Transcript_26943/g.56165 Transcript_26943/m.56165 type:complete len:142 (+) Transcript_26943:98-523(+)